MKNFLPLISFLFVLLSCQKDESNVRTKQLLHEKYHGKYELISSFSKTAVDLNNDGIESMNLLDENSQILFSRIEIKIPSASEHFLKKNEFVFSELWPTENDTRFANKEVIPVYKTRIWSYNYDLYGQTFIGQFEEDLRACTLKSKINNDGKNTLIEIKSIEILKNETIKVTVVRKLFTKNGWVKSEIESIYKKYTNIAQRKQGANKAIYASRGIHSILRVLYSPLPCVQADKVTAGLKATARHI